MMMLRLQRCLIEIYVECDGKMITMYVESDGKVLTEPLAGGYGLDRNEGDYESEPVAADVLQQPPEQGSARNLEGFRGWQGPAANIVRDRSTAVTAPYFGQQPAESPAWAKQEEVRRWG
jgi:hypothetical protein